LCHYVFILAIAALPACAEADLSGTVLDAGRLPVPGATLTLICGVASRSVKSAADGGFAIPIALNARGAACSLEVDQEGFAKTFVPLSLDPDIALKREIVLNVAPVSESVTISERAGNLDDAVRSATKTLTPLQDVPQSIAVIGQSQMEDQLMASVSDAVRYVPGVMAVQGENNRDQLIIRGNSTSADFFIDGVRDDVQYYRDLYNLERVEVLKGPNAMIFGRGGGGGVVNRVLKEPVDTPVREVLVDGGSFGDKRFAIDLDQPLRAGLAARLNSFYQNSDSFRDFVGLERYGISPSLAFTPSATTRVVLNFETFQDHRTADRGISSFQGKPLDIPYSTFFGDPNQSRVRAAVNIGTAAFEHHWSNIEFHDRLLIGDYDRGYQNFVPGTVNGAGTLVAISAYNNATTRRNLFNQADLSGGWNTGWIRHRWLLGMENGHQSTDNFRNTGYFNDAASSIQTPLSATVISTPVVFRQSATDANNHLIATVAAGYLQDQMSVGRRVQVVAGLRYDSFRLLYHDNRTGAELERPDRLLSPRLGLVYKPLTALSLYGSYSVSYLPSSGDQFSSLTTITQQVKPEKFRNLEAGLKWSLARNLFLHGAVYRLDRTNTRSTDPNDPTRIVQTGSQRTDGAEVSLTGSPIRRWTVTAGYGYQNAFVRTPTAAAAAGAVVAQVPPHMFTLWNVYAFHPRLSAGFGLLSRGDMFAAIDNTVVLPGYTRADAALYYSLTERIRLQANVENVMNSRFILNADNNTNLSPGSPRAARVGIVARF
jgi:catecholate siderophore receptor